MTFSMDGILDVLVKLKQSSSERNSAANLQVLESTWMLKSPENVDGDMEQVEVRSSASSDMKTVEGFGGAVDENHQEWNGPCQCKNGTLKRGGLGCREFLHQDIGTVNDRQPTTTTRAPRLLDVDISWGCCLIECEEVQLILPCLCQTGDVNISVSDGVMDE